MKLLVRFIASFLLLSVFAISAAAQSQPQTRQANELFDEATNLYQDGKFDEALPLLTATELNPNDYRPRAMVGYIFRVDSFFYSHSQGSRNARTLG